jgi:hypothetical protein
MKSSGTNLKILQPRRNMQGLDTIMKTVVKDTDFFNNTELGHHLPVRQFVSLKQTHVVSESSVVEYCTALHEEHLQLL